MLRAAPHFPAVPRRCRGQARWPVAEAVRSLRDPLARLGVRVGVAGAGCGLTRGRARPDAAAPALQQRPQRRLLLLGRVALQTRGAVGGVDAAGLPFPPATASCLCTLFLRLPPSCLLHAAPPWATGPGAPRVGSEQQQSEQQQPGRGHGQVLHPRGVQRNCCRPTSPSALCSLGWGAGPFKSQVRGGGSGEKAGAVPKTGWDCRTAPLPNLGPAHSSLFPPFLSFLPVSANFPNGSDFAVFLGISPRIGEQDS